MPKIKALPRIVSEKEWQKERDALLKKEKKLTRELDKLAAARRRLPMVEIEKNYEFEGPNGKVSLLDLFEDRKQLLVYHFMYHPEEDRFCIGCSFLVDQLGHPAHINARDVSLAIISRAPLASIKRHKKKLGWEWPWYSSAKSTFNQDFGMTTEEGDHHGMSVFIRDGKKIYRTYFTTARGVESLGTAWSLLDITPYGRQEKWEDSPKGWPQSEPYYWWRFHDEYK